ncbi:MAG TPA: glycogen debranching protein GlgX [Aliidongia sp.]|nr:glycogen debranching protein GlgX [Aliidongia sp.]
MNHERHPPARPTLVPGKSYPLGATWDGAGVNFALFSANASAVDLCLFDPAGSREVARLRMPDYTDQVWHGYMPEARPGLLYGYRVHGPYEPRNGHRFNPNKVLIDPYARMIRGQIRWADAHFGYRLGSSRDDLSFDRRDNSRGVPKSEVVESAFTWGHDGKPALPWEEMVILEAHVKGLTQRHPNIEPRFRGSFAGLASPPIIDHLVKLGITAIELNPVHFFLNDRNLVERGLSNYWGYNTLGFFAPDPRYLSTGAIGELKTAVRRLHEAGIEIILDVVYNHTAEGNQLGPTLSFRGIDNASYYRLAQDCRYYIDYTGTGNTLNLDHPRVLQMVMDSLRYWANEIRIDGFRFDLATTLAREKEAFDPGSAFLDVIRQDPDFNGIKLMAEPWDVGPDGYRVGGFPPGWAEWNGPFRDVVRRFWKGDEGMLAEMGSRLAGSSDIFGHGGRRPWASINFVTAHDGFTLEDLVSYDAKHNEANGEENRDGHDANFSWNCGVEGPTDDPEILTLRRRQKRNLMATLLLSLGVPMLLSGDELGRTQQGNNNAYCQDNELSWIDWENIDESERQFEQFVELLIRLRRSHRVFSRPHFFRGTKQPDGLKDITWLTPEGKEYTAEDWGQPFARCLGFLLNGRAGEYFYGPTSRRDFDSSFLVLLNAHHEDIEFHIPETPRPMRWEAQIDTVAETGRADPGIEIGPDKPFLLKARSLALFIHRETEP